MGIKAGRLAEIKEELNLAGRLDENHIGLYNTAQRIRMAYKEDVYKRQFLERSPTAAPW